MSRFCRLFLLLTAFVILAGNGHAAGLIPVMNYQRMDYAFGPQNWDITHDELGKLYVANYNGMLSFDGVRWNHYYLPNYSTVRSLFFDSASCRIYAGGSEEFGYFSPAPDSGNLTYVSLSASLQKNNQDFSEVWDICHISGSIIFRCDHCVFRYYDGNLEKLNIPGRISSISVIGRKLFIGMEDGSIFSLWDGHLNTLKKETEVSDKKIIAILPFDDNSLLICTSLSGLYLCQENKTEPLEPHFSKFLKDNQIFCASSQDGVYVFGTVTGGALIYNSNTEETAIINKESGMKNNTVLNAGFNPDGNLWLCLDNGLTYAALDSPCRKLIGDSNFIGAGYSSAKYGDHILLGTNQGLYVGQINSEGVDMATLKAELPGQVWSITKADEDFFISTDRGLFLFDGIRYNRIENIPGVFKTLTLPRSPGKAIASTYDSFYLLKKINNQWKSFGKVSGNNDLKGDFLIDSENRIWLPHWQKGIYLLPFSDSHERFTSCRIFNKNSGLPADDNNTMAFFEGAAISSSYSGIFILNPQNTKSYFSPELSGLLKRGRRGHLKEMHDGSLVLVDEDGLMITKRRPDGILEAFEFSGPALFREIIPGFTDINKYSSDELIVSTQSGFTIVNTKQENRNRHSYLPFVSAIFANHDSLIYRSPLTLGEGNVLKVAPDLSSLRFEFGYPECNFGESTEFSSYLENSDKDWTPFSSEASREYTRLSEGNYVLHLKVKDNYTGEILESTFGFAVTPPWFRTPFAKGVYSIITFICLILLFASVRKRMNKMRIKIEKRKENEMENLRKEAERHALLKDMEIAGLKTEQLEQEIKHKSDELSSTTMSLISKNEILREIGTQISHIQQLSAESAPLATIQKNLSKLQSSIEENINKDNNWPAFNKNFDVVYGDYMKRLLKQHPNLSQSEKRLCCYIRMGLSSKEIAPLVNISFRSVEMARYRLRKKMGLSQEAALSDYLADI